MRVVILGCVAALLALSGCQTAGLDDAVQKNLPTICRASDVAYAGFQAYAATATVSERDAGRVEVAHAILEPICVNPSAQTAASVLARAVSAYSIIVQVMKKNQA